MNFTSLISVSGLAKFLEDPNWVIVDCRFWLDDQERGRQDYLVSHIPGSIYFHLDENLSGPIIEGATGRHPLPDPDQLVTFLGAKGIDDGTQVVVYDDRGGMIAARLWWLLRWLGHENVAVLDGGYPSWVADGNPVTDESPTPIPKMFLTKFQSRMLSSVDDVLLNFGDPRKLLVDSRAPERFRGEQEPIDPIAGRIPGAVNYFWGKNLDSKGYFEIKDILRGRFVTIFRDIPTENIIFYCGSGVTSAHNILAVVHAGLGMPKLYVGSWSHWITDPERPIVIGE